QPGIKIKTSNRFEDYTALTSFRALVGSRVELPCDVTLPSTDDSISLILWYKNDRKSAPIYSVDARNTPVEKAKHFASDNLKNRVKFDLSFRPAILHIDPVKEDDVGIYLCRVDFKWARTVNTLNNLTVIVPPRQVLIKDEHNNPLHDIVGPFDEGLDVRLVCEAYGGIPSPSLIWLRDGVVIDDSYTLTKINNNGNTTSPSLPLSSSASSLSAVSTLAVNDLLLSNLGRSDLFSVLTCQASNTNLSNPVSTSVSLDINLKPLDVQIVAMENALSAGVKTKVICQSRGSRPAATLNWYLDKEAITSLAR
ncbi:nephrin-like protein, partial [Leptotrombidium deliense]